MTANHNMTQDTAIYPVLLAGGSGTRLWPLSRKSYPKQFTDFFGNDSLFQKSAKRVTSSDTLAFHAPVTIAPSDFRFIIGDQLSSIGIDSKTIIIEPEAKNTAPAILASCLYIYDSDPDAVILVTPSDHLIADIDIFHEAIKTGLASAMAQNIVTFGVTPTHPETGFGYLALSDKSDGAAVPLTHFIEKPDPALAKQLVASGTHLWNAGIFLFRAADMISAYQAQTPALYEHVSQAVAHAQGDLDFLRLNQDAWRQCEAISIDYGIMEKITNRMVVPLRCEWKDFGSWNAIWQETSQDDNGVAVSQNATAIDCHNVLLRADGYNQQLVGLGLENIIAIAMNDAVLVAQKDRVQDIRLAVETLKQQNIAQAETFPIKHRPWGWSETLLVSDDFQVKRISVKPQGAISLQSHKHRTEHWVVIKGTAHITTDEREFDLSQGQSTFIPLGMIHRLENNQPDALEIIEIQFGDYVGEDDITRYNNIQSAAIPPTD